MWQHFDEQSIEKSLIIKNTVQEYKEKLQHKSFVIKADKNT